MKADLCHPNSLCGATTVQVDIDLKDATVGFDVSWSIRVYCDEMAKNACINFIRPIYALC